MISLLILFTLLNAKISSCDQKKYNKIKLFCSKLNKFYYRTDKLVIIGKFISDPVKNQEKRSFAISLIVYDTRLADTDNTIARKKYVVKNDFIFPFSYEIEIPNVVAEEDNRYSISVSIRDPNKKNKLVWLTDTQNLIKKSKDTYDLHLIKIGN
jgi:hypothetical protein